MELKTKDYLHFQAGPTNFKGPSLANKGLPGDIVEWDTNLESCKLIIQKKHILTGVIEFNSKTKYGMTSRGYPIYLFIPYLKSYPHMIVGSSHKDCSKNYIALIEFDSWTASLPRANLIRLLGPCGDTRVEEEALRLTYHPYKLPKLIHENILPVTHNRIQCPELTFNIDPIGCKDIDDVLSIQGHCLWITIADVAEQVLSGSPIDIYASQQCQTAYSNGKAIQPMLPYELSEKVCSLHSGEQRPGISLLLHFSSSRPYKITHTEWKLTLVTNKHTFDYDTFKEQSRNKNIDATILQELAQDILGTISDDPHIWIEAFMVKYNLEVAKSIRQIGKGLLRSHSGPDEEKWKQYLQWGGSELAVLANSTAKYCYANETSVKHVGLGHEIYCHATSPIRRYADLVNQRILKAILTNSSYDSIQLPSADWLNKRQQDSKRFERDMFLLHSLDVKELQGIVLSPKKVWVQTWKRIVSWKNNLDAGTSIKLDFFVNRTARCWKERIIFRLKM